MNSNTLVKTQSTDLHNGEDRVPTVYTASSVAEIKAALSKLQEKDASVTSQLDTLVASQKELQRELGRLDLFRASLSTQASKTRSLSNGILSDASSTANRISSSVKRLDLEQLRVKATLTVVEQVGELKACVLGVTGSMGAPQDWETAASYLSRASKIPKEVIEGSFAARIVPTAEVPDPPSVTLENASESLCSLFLREFEKAVKDNDGSKITRFFKLFPLINRSEVGLDVYGRYVCQGVATRARANLNAGTGGNQSKDEFFYANALTKLFEHIAQIVVGHGGLVEQHYGAGKMTRVIERLQVEADLQGGIILDTWADERRIDRLLTDVKSYAYSFLVQSFLPAQRGATSTPRSNSPTPQRTSEDDGVDMKQVDAVLNEMTMMLGKWSLYTQFLTEKCQIEGASEPAKNSPPTFLLNASLTQKVNTRILTPFATMTTFFFRRSVEKAFQLDENPPSLSLNPHKPLNNNPPHISSAIDDIMYIISKIISQSLATSQTQLVLNIIPTLSRVMASDFLGMIQRKMRDESYPKAAIAGALPPEHIIVAFIVLINDLDIAIEYTSQIIDKQLQSPDAITMLFPLPSDAVAVTKSLRAFNSAFTEKTQSLVSDAATVLFGNVMKPRLRPILLDAFRDTDYASTDSDTAPSDGEELDPEVKAEQVRLRFNHGWDALTKPIARLMTPNTFSNLLALVLSYLSKLLEKRIWTYTGRINSSGAQRLERDVNAIIRAVVQGRKYEVRDIFLRCVQICTVMNMEAEEWEELGGQEGVADRLTAEERERARGIVSAEL
jgi:conserved oligomeric Golgi complex subunit 4